jgi:trans-2,3-dihydro-3-hydroxyanthranilate isomerase
MKMEIAWWDLEGSPATVDGLGRHVRQDSVADSWQAVAGLHEKFWIADRDGNRWGAVMIWDDERPAELPPNRAADLIGAPVTHRDHFEVQASVRGHASHRSRNPSHRYVVVDAFATEPLLGNPVAVFFGAADLTSTQMQRIAREMNLSEVTFLLPPTSVADMQVRIFTPVNKLPFAGHPLLGMAVAVAQDRQVDRLRFETAMGIVPFDIDRAHDTGHCDVAYVSMVDEDLARVRAVAGRAPPWTVLIRCPPAVLGRPRPPARRTAARIAVHRTGERQTERRIPYRSASAAPT